MDCAFCDIFKSRLGIALSAIFASICFLYLWSTSKHNFFKKLGIDFLPPIPLLGNYKDLVFQKITVYNLVLRLYNAFPTQQIMGIFEMTNPIIMIRDPELIKQIGVKDFDHFLDHRVLIDEKAEPLFGKRLASLRGDRWKHMRSTLSPAFTGSKIRQMLQFVNDCSNDYTQYLLNEAKSTDPLVVDMKDLFTRFTNDVIATCAFGINVNSVENKENEFYKVGKVVTNFGGLQSIKVLGFSAFPSVMKALGIKIFSDYTSNFFRSIVHDTIKYREENGVLRPDLIHLLMEARQGKLTTTEAAVQGDDGFAATEEHVHQRITKYELEDDDVTSQCLIFFLAGFEPSSSLMCFASHEITANPDVQQKLLDEIDEVISGLDGKPLTYEVIQGMKYLDMVISESLRKWPPAWMTDRICTIPYTLKTQNKMININKGQSISFPIYGLQHDPKYFPNPEKFDPERFNDENKKKIVPFTYIPFGVGPRNCIGSRFALMECKTILVHLLSKFTFEVSEKTHIPLKLEKTGFALKAEKGFWIHLKPRD